jgi:transposase
MLCVDRNIPILGTTKDGNASDKNLNNELLTNISKHLKA